MSEAKKAEEVKDEAESLGENVPYVVFEKTWRLFGFFSFTIRQTVTEKEFYDTVSQRVLEKINVELEKKFTAPPRNR